MKLKNAMFSATIAALGLNVGCIRSYVTTPLNNANLTTAVHTEDGLELKAKAYFDKGEIADKFGAKLADDRQVIPVQLLLQNKSQSTYRVLRASFILEEAGQKIRLNTLSSDEMYEIGRHGYGAPVCGMIFFGVLGIPSLVTTITANGKVQEDYARKMLQDTLLEPTKEATGAVFFNPEPAKLARVGKYKLVVELENTTTNKKVTLERELN